MSTDAVPRRRLRWAATKLVAIGQRGGDCLVGSGALAQKAKGPQLPIVRDAEIDSCCAQYSAPILRAAA